MLIHLQVVLVYQLDQVHRLVDRVLLLALIPQHHLVELQLEDMQKQVPLLQIMELIQLLLDKIGLLVEHLLIVLIVFL